MKAVVSLMLAMAFVAGPAIAVDNPDIRVYLDSDPPNEINEITPADNSTFSVYIVIDCFGEGGGTRGLGIVFDRTFGGVKLGQTSLLGGLDMGDIEDDGWTFVAGVDCVYPDVNGMVVGGYIDYLYQGTPGTIQIVSHPVSGREVLDCNDLMDYFCIYKNFGVHDTAPAGEPGCDCDTAVEEHTWGAIKALYR